MEREPTTTPILSIKKEVTNQDDIKEFAETAMNELLGWYGYECNREENATSSLNSGGSNSSGSPTDEICGWCGKLVDEATALSSATAVYCSEMCFSQSRRANFKKNKTCDWCRHARHSLSIINTQDGTDQLQFCSDRCLNHYKMHIFWRETRVHLASNPHLEKTTATTSTTSTISTNNTTSDALITPDLWLTSPKSPKSTVSTPTMTNCDDKPKKKIEKTTNARKTSSSPFPLITIKPPSKLLAKKPPTIVLVSSPIPSTTPKNHTNTIQVKNTNRTKPRFPKSSSSLSSSGLDVEKNHPHPLYQENELDEVGDTEDSCNYDLPEDLRVRTTPSCLNSNTNDAPVITVSNANNISVDRNNVTNVSNVNNVSNAENVNNVKSSSAIPCSVFSNLLPPPTLLVPYPIILPIPIPIPLPILRKIGKEQSSQTDFDDNYKKNNDLAVEKMSKKCENVIHNNDRNKSSMLLRRRKIIVKNRNKITRNRNR